MKNVLKKVIFSFILGTMPLFAMEEKNITDEALYPTHFQRPFAKSVSFHTEKTLTFVFNGSLLNEFSPEALMKIFDVKDLTSLTLGGVYTTLLDYLRDLHHHCRRPEGMFPWYIQGFYSEVGGLSTIDNFDNPRNNSKYDSRTLSLFLSIGVSQPLQTLRLLEGQLQVNVVVKAMSPEQFLKINEDRPKEAMPKISDWLKFLTHLPNSKKIQEVISQSKMPILPISQHSASLTALDRAMQQFHDLYSRIEHERNWEQKFACFHKTLAELRGWEKHNLLRALTKQKKEKQSLDMKIEAQQEEIQSLQALIGDLTAKNTAQGLEIDSLKWQKALQVPKIPQEKKKHPAKNPPKKRFKLEI